MKGIILSIATVAAATIGLVVADEILKDGGKSVKKSIEEEVRSKRTTDEKEVFKLLDEYENQQEDLATRETVEIFAQADEFKRSIAFDKQVEEIKSEASKKVSDFKESIGYDMLKDQYKKDYDAALLDWKKENDFDARIAKEKDKISEAGKVAQNQKFFTNFATNDSEFGKESAEKIKETIAEAEKKAVKESKKAIKKIEEEYEEFKKSAKKSYDENISELNKKVNAVREEAVKVSGTKLQELNKQVKSKTETIKEAVRAKRTDEEKELDTTVKLYFDKAHSIYEKEDAEIRRLMDGMTKVDIIASYFKTHNWSKIGVVSIMSIPLVPGIVAMYWWTKMIVEVVVKMNKEGVRV